MAPNYFDAITGTYHNVGGSSNSLTKTLTHTRTKNTPRTDLELDH